MLCVRVTRVEHLKLAAAKRSIWPRSVKDYFETEAKVFKSLIVEFLAHLPKVSTCTSKFVNGKGVNFKLFSQCVGLPYHLLKVRPLAH